MLQSFSNITQDPVFGQYWNSPKQVGASLYGLKIKNAQVTVQNKGIRRILLISKLVDVLRAPKCFRVWWDYFCMINMKRLFNTIEVIQINGHVIIQFVTVSDRLTLAFYPYDGWSTNTFELKTLLFTLSKTRTHFFPLFKQVIAKLHRQRVFPAQTGENLEPFIFFSFLCCYGSMLLLYVLKIICIYYATVLIGNST
jgi:hypothetical protein